MEELREKIWVLNDRIESFDKMKDLIEEMEARLTKDEGDLRGRLRKILDEVALLKRDAEDDAEAYEEILTQDFAEEEY
jgi:hypothetical protein